MRCYFNSARAVETISALLQTHRSWNAPPDRGRVQCERSNPLWWARKKYDLKFDLKPFAHFERARAVIHSCCLWNYVSHKVFKLLYKLFNEKIWIVPHLQHYNYFTRAGQRLRRCAACRAKSLTAGAPSAWDGFLRSAFLETADQTPPSDYRPIVISTRSIGAPLMNRSVNLIYSSCRWSFPSVFFCSEIFHKRFHPPFPTYAIMLTLLHRSSGGSQDVLNN